MKHGKADADINCVRLTINGFTNVTLLTKAEVLRLHTSPSGREVTQVDARSDRSAEVKGD